MPRKSKDIKGVWLYGGKDISPDAILFELSASGMACGPVTYTFLYVCRDVMHVARTCKTILEDLFECDFLDRDDYASSVKGESVDEEQVDQVINAHVRTLLNQAKIIHLNASTMSDDNLLKSLSQLIDSFSFEYRVTDIQLVEDWIKSDAIQDWLLGALEDEQEQRPVEKLIIPGHERLIARAINRINHSPL